jgi:hypothetical protein
MATDDPCDASETPKDVGGRPTDYEPGFCERAANLCAQGATDFEVAQELGCHVSTLYRWKAMHPEFREALKVGKEASDDRVESSLYHRAVGYSYPAIKIMQNNGEPVIVPYTEHVPPDVGAATLWLTNRRREDWKQRQSTELSGPNGGPIATRDADFLTDKQLDAIARASGPAPAEPETKSD